MKKQGEIMKMAPKGHSENSQAKGPALDETLES
jgi:hypothetical protein